MVPGKSREIPAGAEDKINEIGFGLYQVHVFVLCAGPFVQTRGITPGVLQQGSVLSRDLSIMMHESWWLN